MLKTKKRILTLALVSTVALATLGGLWLHHSKNKTPNDNWEEGVNYRPPTNQEKNSGDEKKDEIIASQEQQNTSEQNNRTSSKKKSVDVAITDAGQYGGIIEVRSFVPGYTQDGTCTIEFSQGSKKLTRKTPATRDVSSTICRTIEVQKTDFPAAGQWKATVSFNSSNAEGRSDTILFTIN